MDPLHRLSPDERTRLLALLRSAHPDGPLSQSLAHLHGFFTSVVSGPLVRPPEWLRVALGPDDDEHGWRSLDEAREGLDLLMRFHNGVAAEFQKPDGAFVEVFHAFVEPADVTTWCEGYIFGILMREYEWRELTNDPAIRPSLDPIVDLAKPESAGLDPVADPKSFRALAARLPQCALDIREWWFMRLWNASERLVQSGSPVSKTRGRKRKPRQ